MPDTDPNRVIVYYSHFRGWSIFYNEGILRLGFLPEAHQKLWDYCNEHRKRMEIAIGLLIGWEL